VAKFIIFAKSNSMKKRSLYVTLSLLLTAALSSCTGNLAQKLHFTLHMQPVSVNITIPATTDTTGTMTIGPNTTTYNVDSFVRAQTDGQLNSGNIQSVKLKAVTLTLTNATAQSNFQDFQSCSASFYSNTNTTPYEISMPNNPDVYAETLSLPVDVNAELKSYIGNQFTYTVTGKLRHPVKTSLNCTVTFNFDVVVQG
jgi:hypothetical protein